MLFTLHRNGLCFFNRWLDLNQLPTPQNGVALPMSYIVTYYDVLPQLLHNLLDYVIQHTTYLLPRGLLSRILRSVSSFPKVGYH